VEPHAADPVFVALAGHYQFGLVHGPYFPEHVVAAGSDDWFLGMEDDSANGHGVPFLSLSQDGLFIVEGFCLACGGGCLIFRERRKFNLLTSLCGFCLYCGKCFFFYLCFRPQLISFDFDEHLLLHGEVILLCEFVELLLVLFLQCVESLDVFV
jgi:hypothetical protein